jgi:hypothetical protein
MLINERVLTLDELNDTEKESNIAVLFFFVKEYSSIETSFLRCYERRMKEL